MRRRTMLGTLAGLTAYMPPPSALPATAIEGRWACWRRRTGTPGLVYWVEHRSGKRWARALGSHDLAGERPLGLETRFRLASISKPITAVAVMMLRDSGKLDIDRPIHSYFREFEDPRVNVRQLLTQLGGFDQYQKDQWVNQRPWASPLEACQALFRRPPRQPGVRFEYSSPGYAWLGAIIEHCAACRYEAFVEEKILRPHGLGGIRVDRFGSGEPGWDRYGEGPRPAPLLDVSDRLAAGGWSGTVGDCVRFVRLFRDGKLVSAATTAEMMEPVREPKCHSVSLGWEIHNACLPPARRRLVDRTGSQAGVGHYVGSDYEGAWVVAALTNYKGSAPETAGRAMLRDLAHYGIATENSGMIGGA